MNQQALLRKARQLQNEMLNAQKEIESTEFTANVGPVTVVMMGNNVVKSVTIDPDYEITSSDDREMLEDSIVAACQKLSKDISDYTNNKMAKYRSFLGGF